MPHDFQSVSRAAPAGYDETGTNPNWSERLLNAAVTALAVLTVAAIAVLMGMA
jgi:hypothetical protein